jgi:predicted nucleic-acid-binding Zn-ribbon protein
VTTGKLKGDITLRCPRCNVTEPYDRCIDLEVPNNVKTIVIICPKCDDGDFHAETWLDVVGREIEPR